MPDTGGGALAIVAAVAASSALILRLILRIVTDSVTICYVNLRRERLKAPELADWLLARGVSSLSTGDVAAYLGVPDDQVRRRLHVPRQRGQWVSPAHGLWIPVPLEYRTWGAPPGVDIIAALMQHMRVDYYVGWLSAAELHGASHQAPQVFQVATSRHVRSRLVGRTRFEFQLRSGLSRLPTTEFPTTSGSARIATPELTMLDVASDIALAGGIDNAATVIIELTEHETFNVGQLVALTMCFPAAPGRRIGWILSRFTTVAGLDALRDAVAPRTASPSILDPLGPDDGPVDRDWHVRINRDIEEESW